MAFWYLVSAYSGCFLPLTMLAVYIIVQYRRSTIAVERCGEK